jgi:mannose-1-phosphate guanylyltransferase / mannose-6-phosphate isomerase
MSANIHPVILCGGSGTRLWPLSRSTYPKQFSRLVGESNLFQSTVLRCCGDPFAPPVVITGESLRFIVAGQLAEIAVAPAGILVEPVSRNTAPAVLAAALWLERHAPDALVLVAPCDHAIADEGAFRAAIAAAAPRARAGDLLTFGVEPTRPETGYGYIQLAPSGSPGSSQPRSVAGFVEKPDAGRAAEMLEAGNVVWNAGIFLFSVAAILTAYRQHAPDFLAPVADALAAATVELGFTGLARGPWASLPDRSIDRAIMEKASNIATVPLDAGWSDIGTWDAVWRQAGHDADGNARSGHATAIGCTNTLLRSESGGLELVGIGLEDIVAVAMPDAVLVARRQSVQRIEEAVAEIAGRGARQATDYPRDHRPWGWFESVVAGEGFQVKRILVNPGAKLSLQSHVHRAEHWVVVAGTATTTVDKTVQTLAAGQTVYIPIGAIHRLENRGTVPMVLIEVQIGSYLGEDDIVRYEDIYARS